MYKLHLLPYFKRVFDEVVVFQVLTNMIFGLLPITNLNLLSNIHELNIQRCNCHFSLRSVKLKTHWGLRLEKKEMKCKINFHVHYRKQFVFISFQFKAYIIWNQCSLYKAKINCCNIFSSCLFITKTVYKTRTKCY